MNWLSRILHLKLLILHFVHVSVVVGLVQNGRGKVSRSTVSLSTPPSPPSTREILAANAAYKFMHGLKCKDVFFTTEKECKNLVRLAKSRMNIYMAGPTTRGRVTAVLPDGGLSKSGHHDAVLVLDPYPKANFGHLVLVFYLDVQTPKLTCSREGGIHLENRDCLFLALKKRCKNALQRRGRRRNFARRCEINFLPWVTQVSDTDRKSQLLTCRSNIPDFGPCPKLRPANETSGLICNPLRDNTKRCETTHEKIHTSCRVFEICDQAVLISGGWNKLSSLPRHKENIKNVYLMLRRHGFKRRNIKIFFANGAHGVEVNGESHHEVHPAAMKLAMRYHIQKMCTSLHCVDSLVLYMNSPARSDGTSLLWDVDQDGVASEKEKYSVAELLSDLEKCQARQVHLIVDQSYSGEIARAVRRSKHHKNVIVFASSKDNEYSWESDYTRHWVEQNHTRTCLQEVHKTSRKKMTRSTPEMQAGHDTAKLTIFGAPCDVMPPFTHKELRQNYLGCQNLPTALWVIKFLSATQQSGQTGKYQPTPKSAFGGHPK